MDRSTFLLNPDDPPLGGAFDFAVNGFFSASSVLTRIKPNHWSQSANLRKVHDCFWDSIGLIPGNSDPHLSAPPYYKDRKSDFSAMRTKATSGLETRASLLLKRELAAAKSFENSIRLHAANSSDSGSQIFPSPLLFVRKYLTAPDHPASEGYAHALIRAEIFFQALRYYSARSGDDTLEGKNTYLLIRQLISFEAVTASLQKLESHALKRDIIDISNPTDFIVFHLLASKGILLLRFEAGAGHEAARKSDNARSSLTDFLGQRSIWWSTANYGFRLSDRLNALPSAAETMNELDGMPVPLPGAEVLFHNGLRFTKAEGLVGRISGTAGSGKTSFALGLAAALAPLGTRTLYVSAEESSADLLDRLTTLVPPFVRRTRSFDSDLLTWFEPQFLAKEFRGNPTGLINQLRSWIDDIGGRAANPEDCPPGLMPLVVVLDGVHEFYRNGHNLDHSEQGGNAEISELVDVCREFGALVLLLSASGDNDELSGLDYLVDFVITLEHQRVLSSGEIPQRVLTLLKTRRQISRPGSHIFHLSRSKGFRISPSISSELDARRRWKWLEPRSDVILDILQTGAGTPSAAIKRHPLVQLQERSQILITGEGSSGKSAMGLKILSAPLIIEHDREVRLPDSSQAELSLDRENSYPTALEDETAQDAEIAEPSALWDPQNPRGRRRALVLSFLYQEIFYRKSWQSHVQPNRREDLSLAHGAGIPKFDFDCIRFSPGYIGPEDFLKVITRQIDDADLSGYPYHGVLIDGLHNVYLQFPNLENSEMIWPLLFEYLRLKGLTVVTTHTSFKVGDDRTQTSIDVSASRRRIGPLLHALVQGADFTLQVKPPAPKTLALRGNKIGHNPNFSQVICDTALENATTSTSEYFWDRDRAVFYEAPSTIDRRR